ncbi:PREDICTED: rho guanine nucleotide exchange factor 17 isoform X2 [Dinoponera quadriceps]|uniref:Rho guanine nucleotide exchange factor 17 isoform X2 n=1 Tax=Dinoponera quadriceps TaxID=609295 RepID=A0A6P3YFJ0_DINQU|nr:PREDICTED: rho guanine nucleotide exchange factor 17 isoform X2 [Dinoponera quadriceps]
MPRVGGGDGGSGPQRTGGAGGFGGWLGGAARAMTGGGVGGGYVVLGGTRYGLRISQESLPPANSREEPQESRRRKRNSRESDSRERLTEKPAAEKPPIDLAASIADCCCIGPRSRLPLPRIPPPVSTTSASPPPPPPPPSSSSASSTSSSTSSPCPPITVGGYPSVADTVSVGAAGGGCCSPPLPASSTGVAETTFANNSRGAVQTSVGNIGSTSQQYHHHHHYHQQQQQHHHHQHYPQTAAAATSSYSPPTTTSSSSSTSLGYSSGVPTATQTVSVPRQLAQWTKHQTLKLQEPAVIAVDRLHRFRWSGGGGGSGKKSSSGPRSEKAERLRELTEKLKGPAPVPPPRRPSRVQASSPPPSGYQPSSQNYPQTGSNSGCGRCDGRPSQRSYTYSEGSQHGGNNQQSQQQQQARRDEHPKTIVRSESVSEECLSDRSGNNNAYSRKSCQDSRKSSRSGRPERNSGDVSDLRSEPNASAEAAKHLRQYSDSVVDSATSVDDLCDNLNAASGNEGEARDAITRLEPRGLLAFHRAGAPFRSASFGQVDFNQDADFTFSANSHFPLPANRQKSQPIATSNRTESSKDVRASTLPRRRGDATSAGTTPQNSPNRQSPRTSTPSVDSAVGSAEGLGVPQQGNLEEIRPRSDGSDSLATSSALTSPEPLAPETNEPRVDLVSQSDAPVVEVVNHESVYPMVDGNTVEETVQKETRIEPHEVIITPPPEEPRLSQASEGSEALSETPSEASSPSGKARRYRGDTSKRRKGVYITQWPEPLDADRNKLSAQSSEERDEPPATPSDLSDCEGHTPRRYSKRPLRGPYGQMLEAEMAKPRTTDIALEEGLRPRRKISANLSYNASSNNSGSEPPTPCHHRTTSSPTKLEGLPGPSPELLAELLRGSSERVARAPAHRNDTRTHVVVELYDTERSYVEALQILVNKYLQPLKSPENAGLVDSGTVDEIFYQIPAILGHHEVFLEELRRRLDTWEPRQTIGDVFLDVFTKPLVLETYTLFLDNWKSARKAIKTTCQAKPAFARFLETMEREHKGKLGLDQLLIKPVQKIPRYELLIQRLLKHTDPTHPDYELLQAAQKEVHELVVKINCTERESLEWEQQQTTLKEVQALVEGLAGIVTNDRAFVRHDLVTIASNQGTRKERALFLFSDLLVITSIKRRSGTIRKPSTSSCPSSLVGLLEANKYKMLMRIPLDDLEVMKAKDENLRRMAREVDHLRENCLTLTNLQEVAATLHGPKQQLEELIKDMLGQAQRQLAERNAADSQLACLELTLNTQSGIENISVMFTKPDKRASWEESFNEAKQKLALSADRRPCPEFVGPLPIRKTRAGLQFTCAAPTLASGQGTRDVWVCNSDGYVGQVCVLSLSPEPPQVTSCNGVCNARILCVAGIPACTPGSSSCTTNNSPFINSKSGISISVQDMDASGGNIQLDSSSSSDESDSDDIPCADTGSVTPCGDVSSTDNTATEEDINQPTMWLGTEDGYIHVYNCNDNIRIKKNKVKIQHGSGVHCIIYLDNKVFVSLANGDITVYARDHTGGWNTPDPTTVSVGTAASPVTKMLSVSGKIWCGCHNSVKVLNIHSLDIEHMFAVSSDTSRAVSCMANSGGSGVWISLHNSAVLRLFHSGSYECLADINIAPAVTKMLASCDDIIRQHKAACLRVTALLACNELLWIGTSAGVLLTVPIPHIKPSTQRMSQPPIVTGIPHGHTGHVRFLTCVETTSPPKADPRPKVNRYSLKSSKTQPSNISRCKFLVISGGDGYEDFRGPQASAELQAGREDSTNHLLLWKV